MKNSKKDSFDVKAHTVNKFKEFFMMILKEVS